MTKSSKFILKIYLLLSGIFLNYKAIAQFTYVGANLNFNILSIETSDLGSDEGTNIRGMDIQLQFLSRPFKNIGFGASLSIPGTQKTEIHLASEGGNFIYNPEYSTNTYGISTPYSPTSFNYNLERKLSTTLFARFISNSQRSLYLDIRYSFMRIEEIYSFFRPEIAAAAASSSQLVPQEDFSSKENITLSGVGFSVGIMPMITDKIYYQTSATLDVLSSNSKGFTHEVSTAEGFSNDDYRYSKINSSLNNTTLFWSLNIGFGCYF
jgi:hypothetical protein